MRTKREKQLCLRLSGDETTVLEEEAEARGTTSSAILREALRTFLGKERFRRERAA